ncbi:MAG: response regulator [Spirochaetales bacterium]|nr:response regulator [Spirochaetales bacterium]
MTVRPVSLRQVLAFGITGLIILTMTIIILSTYLSSRRVFLKHAQEIMQNTTSYTIDKTRKHLDPAKDAARLTSSLATNRIVTNKNIRQMEKYFYEQLSIYTQFSGIFFSNSNGDFIMASEYIRKEVQDVYPDALYFSKIISNGPGKRDVTYIYRNDMLDVLDEKKEPSDPYDPRKRSWYIGAVENRSIFWASPYIFSTSQRPGITTSSPVFGEDGSISGVVGVDIEIEELSRFISSLKIGIHGKAFIVDMNGQMIAYPDINKLLMVNPDKKESVLASIDQLDDMPAQIAFAKYCEKVKTPEPDSYEFINFKYNRQTYHAMFTPFSISDWPWLIGIYLPEDDYIGSLKENRNSNIYFVVIMAIIATLSAAMLSNSITRPILNLQRKTSEIIEGKTIHPEEIKTIYTEIKETADHFDRMQRSLANYRTRMEEIIRKRTRELESSNKELHLEVENRKFVEKQLIDARNKADKANRAKSEFLAGLSHEIRTPLGGIIGLSEILSQKYDPEQKDENFQTMLRESDRLINLLNRLLDLSKIESGDLELKEEVFDLEKTIKNAISTFDAAIKEKALSCAFIFTSDSSPLLLGDELRISQIFLNLVSNAIKFTEQGSITVRAEIRHLAGEENEVFCSVKDTGIGLDEQEQKRIFRQYMQSGSSMNSQTSGTGLGIPICSELIEMMDGRLGISSEKGKGTEFTFTLHLPSAGTLPEHSTTVSEKKISLKGLNIMLAEDYEVNRKITTYHLESAGCKITVKTNGKEAVEAVSAGSFDLVLMDVRMPILDGISATRQIRALENGKSTPIIGITANAFLDNIIHCLDQGMDDVLIKPFRKANLISMIAYWKNKASKSQPPRSAVFTEDNRKNIFNYDELRAELDNDENICREIINGFIIQTKKDLARLSEHFESLDDSEIHRIAHSMKSGAYNIFAGMLGSAAFRLENSARKKVRYNYKRHINIMLKRFDQLQEALRNNGFSL